jgi:hypothetical protein
MIIISLVVISLIRIILPFMVLIAFGEWIRHREANYWVHR